MSKQEVITQGRIKKDSKMTNSISRRDFIKLSGTVGAVAALSDFTIGGPISTLVGIQPQAATVQEDVWIPTTCHVCDRACGTLVHRVNGVVVKVEGNPACPDSQGRICAKGNAGISALYNPWRVKAPMKRTNPEKGRGVDPKWVEITWDEALNTIADKLKAVKAKDPRSFVTVTGHRAKLGAPNSAFTRVFGTTTAGVSAGGGQTCYGFTIHLFAYMYFGKNEYNIDHTDPNCRFYIHQGDGLGLNCKAEPFGNRELIQHKENGTKYVSIVPMFNQCVQKADRWIPIKPRSDLAFMMAFINVIVNELHGYDVEWLKNRSNAPYLIKPDGYSIRAKEPLIKDPARLNQLWGKPLVWDPVDKKAKTFDDATVKDYALEGTFTVDGVQVKPAFQTLKDLVKDYTPEWAAELTDVPAQTIRDLAKEFVDQARIGSTITIDGVTLPYRPVMHYGGRGLHNHTLGFDTQMATTVINMLVGAWGVSGGHQGQEDGGTQVRNPVDGMHTPGPNNMPRYSPVKFPPQRADVGDLYPINYKQHTFLWRNILEPDKHYLTYPVEVLMICGANAISGAVEPDMIAEALKKVPFTFTIAYEFDDMAEMSDIVLADHSYMERYNPCGHYDIRTDAGTSQSLEAPAFRATGKAYTSYSMLRQPTLDKPLYNTMDGSDILIELSERVGILYGKGGVNDRLNVTTTTGPYQLDLNKKYTWAEIFDRQLKATYDDQHGLEWFKKNWIHEDSYLTPKQYYQYAKHQDPVTHTPGTTIRTQFYCEHFVWVRDTWMSELKKYNISLPPNNEYVTGMLRPFPIYNPNPQIGGATAVPAEYDLWCVNAKTMIHSMAAPMSQAWLGEAVELMDPYSMMLWMNPKTAQSKGMKTGDNIWVESPWGKTSGQVKVTNLIVPGAVGILGTFGFKASGLPPFTHLGPHANELWTLDERYCCGPTLGNETDVRVKVYKA